MDTSKTLWATYDHFMTYAKERSRSNAEYEYVIKMANKVLERWFRVIEDERRAKVLGEN